MMFAIERTASNTPDEGTGTPVENGPPPADKAPLRATVVIRNPQGLHMRPAMMFARIATRYRSNVTVRAKDRAVNGKSLLNLMTLAALPGTELELEVSGEDAATALPVLTKALAAQSADDIGPLLN
jgi:phosphotransferase system HPr (HPr) family protein